MTHSSHRLVRVNGGCSDPSALTVMGFRATQTDEGLVVHDVPIFYACTRVSPKHGELDFDETWVRQAVKNALLRQSDDYFAPMHVRHHEKDVAVEDAGFVRITNCGPISLSGKVHTAIFADLVFTDPDAADKATTMRLPHRSVEIFRAAGDPNIDGLALLTHEAPFLKLPMLRVSEVIDERVPLETFGEQHSTTDLTPMVAFSEHGTATHLIIHEGPDMATITKTPEAIAPGEAATNQNFGEGVPVDSTEGDGDGESEGDGTLDVSSVVKAIEKGSISIADMQSIMAAITAQGSTDEPEPEEPTAPAPAPAPDQAMRADTSTMTPFEAEMSGKIVAMEARETQRNEKDAIKADVDEAMELLRDRPLGCIETLKQDITLFRTDHGAAAFKPYIQAMAKNATLDPDFDTRGAPFKARGKEPDVVMKFQDQGPDAVTMAAKFNADFDELQSFDQGLTVKREFYVENNMAKWAKSKG